jgi:hypothetical protein
MAAPGRWSQVKLVARGLVSDPDEPPQAIVTAPSTYRSRVVCRACEFSLRYGRSIILTMQRSRADLLDLDQSDQPRRILS